MSRIERYDEAAKTVDLHCSGCREIRAVPAVTAEPVEVEAGPPVLGLTCPCGTTTFVPFNDWRNVDLVPDVEAERWNQLHYMRGRPKHPDVRLVALDKRHGEAGVDGTRAIVPVPDGEVELGLMGDLVPFEMRETARRLAKRETGEDGKPGRVVGAGELAGSR